MDKGLLLRSRMSSGHWLYPSFVSLSLLLVFVSAAPFALSGDKKPTKDTKGASQTKYVRPTDPAQYVGVETCKTCHDEISKGFENTPHFATSMAAKLDAHAGPEWQGCEACHGPGKAHVDGGGDKTKIFTFKDASPVQISARCLDCHANSHEQNNFGRSAHLQSGVSCIDCHSPHHARESEFLLKESAPKLCYACHLDVRAEFARPFHHRVNEGLVQCADCHNAHGGFLAHQLRRADGYDEVCYKPRRKAGALRLPARSQDRRLHCLPFAARLDEPENAKTEPSESLVYKLPFPGGNRGAPRHAQLPQPIDQVPGLHALPCGDSWFQHQPRIFHTLRKGGNVHAKSTNG